jgi:phage tail sheath protein FI
MFEPNDEALWAQVRRQIGNFLLNLWKSGGLAGIKPEEAYFVAAGRRVMTQDDIDNGRLIVEIGLAAVRPAEFLMIRIRQMTGQASL